MKLSVFVAIFLVGKSCASNFQQNDNDHDVHEHVQSRTLTWYKPTPKPTPVYLTTSPPTYKPTAPPTAKPTTSPTVTPVCSISIAVSSCTFGGSTVDCRQFNNFLTPDNCDNTRFNFVYTITNTGVTRCNIDSILGATRTNLASSFNPNPLASGASSSVSDSFNQNVCGGATIAFPVNATAHVFPNGLPTSASTSYTLTLPSFTRPPTSSPTPNPTPAPTSKPTASPTKAPTSAPTVTPVCSIEISVTSCTFGGSSVACSQFNNFLNPDNCDNTEFDFEYTITNTGVTQCNIDSILGATLTNLASSFRPNPLASGASSTVSDSITRNVCGGATIAFPANATAHVFPDGLPTSASTSFTLTLPSFTRPPTTAPTPNPTPAPTAKPTASPTKAPTSAPTVTPVCSIEISVSSCTFGGSSVACSQFNNFLNPDNCDNTRFNFVYTITNTGVTRCNIDSILGATLTDLASSFRPNPLASGASSTVSDSITRNVCGGATIAFPANATAHVFPNGLPTSASTSFTLTLPSFTRPPTSAPTPNPTPAPTPKPTAFPTKAPTSAPTTTPVCSIAISVSSCTFGGSNVACSQFNNFLNPDTCVNTRFNFIYNITNTGVTKCIIDSVIGRTNLNLASLVSPNPLPSGISSPVSESINQNVCGGALISFPIVATARVFPNGLPTSAFTSFNLTLPPFTRAPTSYPTNMPTMAQVKPSLYHNPPPPPPTPPPTSPRTPPTYYNAPVPRPTLAPYRPPPRPWWQWWW